MSIRSFIEECILEFAKIIEESRDLRCEVDDLQHMNDEYEQFIGDMGMEDVFLEHRYDVGGHCNDDFYVYPSGYGSSYPRAYGKNYQYEQVKQFKPGEINVAALACGINKMFSGGDESEKFARAI